MIVTIYTRALGQLSDPAFRRVLLIGIGATVALLVAIAWVFVTLLGWLVPDALTLPFVGEITWLDDLASGLGILSMLGLSVFLMVPVASAFTSLFLEDIADAVEARHYPGLPPAPKVSFADGLRDTFGFLGVLVVANLAALVLYLFFVPLAPLIFWGLNGFLLGREYFQVTAMRRLGRQGAAQMRKRHIGKIWLAGVPMAMVLSLPLVNLVIPVVGAAAFTHLYHTLAGSERGKDFT
ncbi:EI24 domain-containing protein [Dinoroseobacter sp. PD6]|uniref:EI24 domain-containing protein n=1 Tax=Dinoroseobacter sp. PD6 TaxID=3028384 RepID=UPI00237BD68E|nr:EI24 domain-containing protein [Dinoroseobacter sp. PD6]MDD9717675.1 EI24 domain-containing protein [Dinoroseobacter sp. PD6]